MYAMLFQFPSLYIWLAPPFSAAPEKGSKKEGSQAAH